MATIKTDASSLRVGLPQVIALGAAIISVAFYAARIEARAVDAQTRVVELKAELTDIRKRLTEQGAVLASVQADGRAILRTLGAMRKPK